MSSAAASLLPKVNVSFSGCGFLGVYHIGSYACWKEHQDRSLKLLHDSDTKTTKVETAVDNCATASSSSSSNHSSIDSNDNIPSFVIHNALGASAGKVFSNEATEQLALNY